MGGSSVATLEPTSEDAQVFCEIFLRLYERLLAYAGRFVDLETARDAVSEVFADIWLRWARLTPAQRSDRYFFGAVHHKVLDARAAHDAVESYEEAEPQIESTVVQAALSPSRGETAAEVLDRALAAMPQKRREVLLLIYEESLTWREAAEVLGLSIGTINSHMRLATADLRSAFTRAGFKLANPKTFRLQSPKRGKRHD